jgi:phospholipid transport system substrate-binding protein
MKIKYILPVAALMMMTILASPTMASERAVSFVQEKVAHILSVLSDPTLSEEQKSDQFEQELLKTADVKVIARFVLGKYAATASTKEFNEFSHAFQLYALNVYQSELSNFGSEVFEVKSSEDRRPGDSVILTTISGGAMDDKSEEIKWRVLNIKGAPRVVDMQISGVWLSQHQRAEITGIIAKNNGDVRAATKMLCERSAQCDYTG